MNPSIQDEQPSATTPSDTYEPPRVESALTSEELEREVLYAGAQTSQVLNNEGE